MPLYDPARPTNVWKLEGVGDFALPPGTVISALLNLDRVLRPTPPPSARNMDCRSVPVLGPWSGTLDHDGETLKLLRPARPNPMAPCPIIAWIM